MAVTLVRVTLPNINGLTSDEVVNDFVFNAPSSDAAAVTAVKAFYNAVPDGFTTSLDTYISGTISRTVLSTIQTYDLTGHLDGSPHGSPTSLTTMTLAATGVANALPDQLALVLSYHADYGTAFETGPTGAEPTDARARKEGAPATHTGKSRPKSSLRGRLYIGPLNLNGINAAGHLSASTGGIAAEAGQALMTAALGWCVWSRRLAAVHNIVGGWRDEELGVQRRRKEKAPIKTPWVGTP